MTAVAIDYFSAAVGESATHPELCDRCVEAIP
jgi:hypothetical protein